MKKNCKTILRDRVKATLRHIKVDVHNNYLSFPSKHKFKC